MTTKNKKTKPKSKKKSAKVGRPTTTAKLLQMQTRIEILEEAFRYAVEQIIELKFNELERNRPTLSARTTHGFKRRDSPKVSK